MSAADFFVYKGLNYHKRDGVMTLGGVNLNEFGNAYADESVRKRKLVLKSYVNGRIIKSIAKNAFRANSSLGHIEYLEIQEGFEYIGDHAFRDCCMLKTVYIPSTMKVINDCAFLLYNLSRSSQSLGTCTFIFVGPSSVVALYSFTFSHIFAINIYICIDHDITKQSGDTGTSFECITKLNIFTPKDVYIFGVKTTALQNAFFCYGINTIVLIRALYCFVPSDGNKLCAAKLFM